MRWKYPSLLFRGTNMEGDKGENVKKEECISCSLVNTISFEPGFSHSGTILENCVLDDIFLNTLPLPQFSSRGMRHTSMALYVYGTSQTCLHEFLSNFLNNLFWENFIFNNYLQLLHLEYLSQINLIVFNDIFVTKIVPFLQSPLNRLFLVKIKQLLSKHQYYSSAHFHSCV